MLSGMSHDQWDEWCGKDMIEPIGTPQQLCEVLSRIGSLIAGIVGTKIEDEQFMPWTKGNPKPEALTPRQSVVAIGQTLRTLAGGLK